MAQQKSAYEKLLDRLKVKAPELYRRLKAKARQTYSNLKESEASTNQTVDTRSALARDAETLGRREQSDFLRLQGGIAADRLGANPAVGTKRTINGQLMIFDGDSFKPKTQLEQQAGRGRRETRGPMRTWSNAYGVGGVTPQLTEAEATQQPVEPVGDTTAAAATTPTRDLFVKPRPMNTAETKAAGLDPMHVWARANQAMINRSGTKKQQDILKQALMVGTRKGNRIYQDANEGVA
jgi:hypothetical protein